MSRRRLAGLAVVLVLVILFGGRWLAVRYTEHLWFDQLGQARRHGLLTWRALGWQAGLLAALFAWFAAHTFAVYRSIGSVQLPRRLGNIEITEAVPSRTLRALALGCAGLLALATTWAFADFDHYVALYRHAVPLGIVDPVLQRDAAFYLARLPLLEVAHLLVTVAVLLASLVTIALYSLTGSLSVSRRRVRITPHARTHMVVLLTSLALIIAWGFRLDALQLVGGGGTREGVLSVVDRSVRIPASHALALIALVVAAGSALSLRWTRPVALFALWATLAAAALLGRFLVPAMSDAWDGEGRPAVAAALARYGDGHTRAAFGLLDARMGGVSGGDWTENAAAPLAQALAGLLPWSGERALLDASLSRAVGDSARVLSWSVSPVATGRGDLAILAVGQADLLTLAQLAPRPRWDELHRQVMAWGGDPVALDARLRRNGAPALLTDLEDGETASGRAGVRRVPGRVRFLPRVSELGIVSPGEGTADQPPPGVLLRGLVRRVLLAWALQSPPLMDGHTGPADRVLYWRDVPSRLSRLYPFASFDGARPLLVQGRLVWVADGYVLSRRFPLAEQLRWNGEDLNYLSSPYLATVDAETGETLLYLRPPDLPFARGLAKAEGVEPLPSSRIPAGLARQLVYPAGLLGAQTAVLGRVMSGAGERPWIVAAADTSLRDPALLPPAMSLMERNGGEARIWSFHGLVEPSTSRLAAVAAGAIGPGGALELELIRADGAPFPTTQAAASRMAGAPVVVAAAVAAGGPGALRHGPVSIIPAGGTIAYTRVLFAHSPPGSTDGPTQPVGIAILAGGRVGFGPDAESAVRALSSADGGADQVLGGSVNLAEARAAFLALDSARVAGDWERFGRAWSALRRALNLERGTPSPRP